MGAIDPGNDKYLVLSYLSTRELAFGFAQHTEMMQVRRPEYEHFAQRKALEKERVRLRRKPGLQSRFPALEGEILEVRTVHSLPLHTH